MPRKRNEKKEKKKKSSSSFGYLFFNLAHSNLIALCGDVLFEDDVIAFLERKTKLSRGKDSAFWLYSWPVRGPPQVVTRLWALVALLRLHFGPTGSGPLLLLDLSGEPDPSA